MREKLVKLLQSPHKAEQLRKAGKNLPSNDGSVEEIVADFLILNGVTIEEKPRTNFDKITESVESLAEFIVEASEYQIDEYLFTYYNPALECSTSDKEEAIKGTIKWLQKEADNE